MSSEEPYGQVVYRVGDRFVSHLSGYVYKVTALDAEARTLRFAASEDPEDESGWESFADAASTFRHIPSEVLPETPEPPRLTHDEARAAAIGQMKAAEQRREDVAATDVEQVDRDQLHQNVRFAIADPGHFLPRKVDEPVSHWSARAVMDVLGMLDMLGAPGEGYTVLASQSVPAVPVSSTGGKETGEAAETGTGSVRATLERDGLASFILGSAAVPSRWADALSIADALLAAGWQPPLPEVMYDAGETAEEAVRRLAAEVVGLRQQLSSLLPDSETERQRWFIIAGPGIPTELGERPLEADWDGIVYSSLTADLAASLAACRQTYDDWGVYELVRVSDPEVTS